jgi:hypothetical protein
LYGLVGGEFFGFVGGFDAEAFDRLPRVDALGGVDADEAHGFFAAIEHDFEGIAIDDADDLGGLAL